MTSSTVPPRERSLLESPQVRAAIRTALWKMRVDPQQIDDLTQDVFEHACRVEPPPATLEQCIALAIKIAKDMAVDHLRKDKRRRKVDAGPVENADVYPSRRREGSALELLEDRQALALVQRQTEQSGRKGRAAAIAVMSGVGVKAEEIAKQFGITLQTVHNMASRGRGAMAASGILLLVGLVVWLLPSREVRVGSSPPGHPHRHEAPEPSPLDTARDLRRRALHDCDVGRWAECVHGLDQAAELDRAGDADAAVQRARASAAKHLSDRPPSSAPAP